VPLRGPVEICDLGAGCGIIGLALLKRIDRARLTAVELQPRLAELARRNLIENELGERGEVLELDLAVPREARRLGGGRFDWVLSNPPYRALGRGATNPEEESAIARHELRLPLARLIAEQRRLLRPRGYAALVYPSARLGELMGMAIAVGLQPRTLRLVHPRADEPATRALVLLAKGGAAGTLTARPPLIERRGDGTPTDELRRITGDAS